MRELQQIGPYLQGMSLAQVGEGRLVAAVPDYLEAQFSKAAKWAEDDAELIEVFEQIEAARALGDLSENGDYHAAKDFQGKMESRIRQLQALLKNVEIVA